MYSLSYKACVCSHLTMESFRVIEKLFAETLFYHQTIEKLCFLQAIEKF